MGHFRLSRFAVLGRASMACAIALAFFFNFSGSVESAHAGGFVDLLVRQNLARKLDEQSRYFSPDSLLSGFRNGGDPSFLPSSPALTGVTEGTFDQLIDPSRPGDNRTFKQRYFINSTYASGPDAPVFYYICGESTCSAPRGAAVLYARQFQGYVISLEHRYYGSSQPTGSLSSSNLRYLKTEYALADLARFQTYAQSTWNLRGKWIAIGGSYPGSLAAYYRLKYPSLVVGSLASSAPVQAVENFEAFDWVVNDRAGSQCASAIRAVVAQLEQSLRNDPSAFASAKHKFQCDRVQDPVDFLYIVADMAAAAVQYGMKDQFCNKLLAGGSDPVGAYASAGVQAFARLGMKPEEDSFMAAKNENPSAYATGIGLRQWLYQSCTEYGYFQNAYHDPSQSTRSAMINPAFHRKVCQELFGTPALNTSKINLGYYQPLLNPETQRVLFTNGSNDPWSVLSISRENGNATNPNLVSQTIAGAAHCDDLGPLAMSSSPVGQAQQLFMSLASQWLK